MNLSTNQINSIIVLFSLLLGVSLGVLALNYSNLPLGFSSIIGWCILMFGYSKKRKVINKLVFISAITLIVGWGIYIAG
jgi:multidrug efflux pump subunit AcrB